MLDSICIEAVRNNETGYAEVVSPTGEVIVQIPVTYLYTNDGVNQSNISSVKAAVKHSGGCTPVTIAHDNTYVYVTTSVLGDFCFYSGDEIEATVNSNTSDLKVVLETDHPGVTGYDAVYTARAYQNGVEISKPVFSTDVSEIAISGNTVTVPASFKDNTSVDGTKLTVTAGDSDKITAYYPLMIRNWENVVTDDFSGTSLDTKIWSVFNGEGTEQGTGATANYNANALKVADGNLEIRVVKESDATFSIPRISTYGKYEQTYGLFSAKIKTPKNTTAGVNTAFWLLPTSGSWGTAFIGDMGDYSVGEVDVLETSPYWQDNRSYNAQTAIHTWDKDGNKTKNGNEKSLTNSNIASNTAYVDVACVWTENALYFYYDGELVRKEAIKSNPAEKVYAVLSMSIAGYDGKETWLGKFADSDVPSLVSYVDSVSISK